MLYFSKGSPKTIISTEELKIAIENAVSKIGDKKKVLIIPPDFTRFHSKAGLITQYLYRFYGNKVKDILPALGTHFKINESEKKLMFGDIPDNLFRIHNWKEDLITLGEVPGDYIYEVSEGKLNFPWLAQVNKLVANGGHDLIFSVGQVVPHEVIGMANYNKNIFVGVGGKDGIHKSHYLGAVYGMERIMGRADTPVRKVLNYASDNFAKHLPIIYILTVIGKDDNNNLVIRGLYIGDDVECFYLAAELSLKVNFIMLEKPLKKVVVYLDPHEFKSTWLGNKSVYRTRMAIDDNGELIVLAPGLSTFGEDAEIDKLIRKYGYRTSEEILNFVKNNDDIGNNLAAAAHLIHGSSENRFKITYCPGNLSKEEIEAANFNYAPLDKMLDIYNPNELVDGFNLVNGEEIYYISNPALGLWASKNRFN
jgi:nickel-dependent lactate racemase